MALLNRPLTEDEAREMVADWRKNWPRIPTFYDMLVDAMNNPTPHAVHYAAKSERPVVYVSPKEFYVGIKHKSPSDCTWIVPGTHKRDF